MILLMSAFSLPLYLPNSLISNYMMSNYIISNYMLLYANLHRQNGMEGDCETHKYSEFSSVQFTFMVL
jgi:hypothetical protein